MTGQADVFISYSREDKERVLSLAGELRGAGISLWIDEGNIDGATMWGEEIVNALENAKVLLLMVTENAVASHNVVKEVVLASERKSHILPIHLEPTQIPQSLKYSLAGIQHIEYFRGDIKDNVKLILRSLERLGIKAIVHTETVAIESQPKPHQGHSSLAEADFASYGNATAVLPFENSSPDPDSEYFSDGLTDELITNLSKITELQVVSRILSTQYKGVKKDPRVIGQELKARYLVSGSVRKSQNNLRISAQLIDIATERELWAEKYKGTLEDVFDIQENVSQQIAEALKLKLTPIEKAVLTKRATIVPEAYDSYLKARNFLWVPTRTNLRYAERLFKRAIELDMTYAEAYAGLASTYANVYQLFEREASLLDKAMDNSLRALMYDRELADAYAAMSLVYLAQGNTDDAITASRKAMEFGPDNFIAHTMAGRLMYTLDRIEEAVEFYLHAIHINPENFITYNVLGMCYERLGWTQKAKDLTNTLVELLPRYLAQHPEDGRAHMTLAVELAKLGRAEESRIASINALEISPNDTTMLYFATCLYSRLGDLDLAITTFRTTISSGWSDYEWIKRDPDLDPIRNEPGFIELMKGK
jgi:adenylate cyclase